MGYRREHQVEHRGEFAVRGGIVDVFPSTADAPVRIDLWGDEVDRLTAFSVSDQRSSHDLRAVALYGCRELVVTPALRAAAAALVTRRPWGASVWENLAEGAQFDGMESWLPFLDDTARVLPDLLPAGAQVVLVEPRRFATAASSCSTRRPRWPRRSQRPGGRRRGRRRPSPGCMCPSSVCSARARPASPRCHPFPKARTWPHSRCAVSTRWRGTRPAWRRGHGTGGPGLLGRPVCRHRGGSGAVVRRLGGRGRARAGARGRAGHGGGLRGGGADHQRVHPARGQGRSPLGDRRHRPARPAPPGPSPGAGGRRLLRRPRGRELRGAPPARRGALRGRDDEDHGRDDPRLPDPAVPGLGPPLPPGRADRGHHALQRGRVPDALEDGRFGLAEDPGQGPRRRQRGGRGVGRAVPPPPGRRGEGVRPRHAVADGDGSLLRLRRDRGPAQGDRRREGRHGGAAADGPPGLR